jgi:hypothetical protein
MVSATSADLARSMTFENCPIQLKISLGVTNTYASPELIDDAVGLTNLVWHIRRPLTWGTKIRNVLLRLKKSDLVTCSTRHKNINARFRKDINKRF